jgi:hypothetical protein
VSERISVGSPHRKAVQAGSQLSLRFAVAWRRRLEGSFGSAAPVRLLELRTYDLHLMPTSAARPWRLLWRMSSFERPSSYDGCTLHRSLAWDFLGSSSDRKWPASVSSRASLTAALAGLAHASKVSFLARPRTHTVGHKLTFTSGR